MSAETHCCLYPLGRCTDSEPPGLVAAPLSAANAKATSAIVAVTATFVRRFITHTQLSVAHDFAVRPPPTTFARPADPSANAFQYVLMIRTPNGSFDDDFARDPLRVAQGCPRLGSALRCRTRILSNWGTRGGRVRHWWHGRSGPEGAGVPA